MVASLIALFLVISAVLVLTFHGMKDETLLAILATGAVGIAQTIAGVKPTPQQPPGSSLTLAQTVAPEAPQPVPAPAEALAPSGIDKQ